MSDEVADHLTFELGGEGVWVISEKKCILQSDLRWEKFLPTSNKTIEM